MDIGIGIELVYEYKEVEYRGSVMYSEEDQVYFGEIYDLEHATFAYEGNTIEELKQDFAEAVETYHWLRWKE